MVGLISGFALAVWDTLRQMSPFLLFGFFTAGILSVFIQPEMVERHLGGGGILQIVKAALLGVPLPLCSCGVIPVAASLRRHGASPGATTSFLISTPQTGVDSILVTFSLLGPVFAIFRPAISFVSGIVGGVLVSCCGDEKGLNEKNPPVCGGECCAKGGEKNGFLRSLHYGFVTLPEDLSKALIIGILIAGVISVFVPDDYFAGILGGGIASMLVMMAVGIPMYVCATASIPIAAALIAKGISPGAALVFLMTGPATNAATISTIWKIMGKRTAVIYLSVVALCAIAAGFLLNYLFAVSALPQTGKTPWMIPGYVEIISAVILIAILAGAFFRSSKAEKLK